MPVGNTYEAIRTETLASAQASVTFSSIPSTYTDLVLITNGTYDTADAVFGIRFNSDTGSNYSDTDLYGNGSAAGSYRSTSQSKIQVGWYPYPSSQAEPGQSTIQIMNYSNATTYKTTLERAGLAGGQGVYARVGLWRSTSAITSVTLLMSAGNFASGTTFSLYGIKAA